MSNDSSVGLEFFQKLLESAFAVQESGINTHSLARVLEVQCAIKSGHLDVDGTMHLIAQCARQVANADGVAVGRVRGDELFYAAGSGSAASKVGRRVMATFSASATEQTRTEILRVENADADPRIEAAICRQFGANSLLILPIYFEGSVAGVMQVLFNDAHTFQEQEVRIYRLLAGLVGEAISQVAQLEQAPAYESPGVEPEAELMPAPVRDLPVPVAAPPEETQTVMEREEEEESLTAWKMDEMAVAQLDDEQAQTESGWRFSLPSTLRVRLVPAFESMLSSGLVVAAVLLVVSWVLYRDRPSTMFAVAPTAPSAPTPGAAPTPFTPAAAAPPINKAPDTEATGYVARNVGRAPVPHFSRRGSDLSSSERVRYFGDDVTVRYFNPKPVPVRAALHDGEVHRYSDDVTVRYFRPRNVSQGKGFEAPTDTTR